MSGYELNIDLHISIEGSREFVEGLRDQIDDLVYDAFSVNCGQLECCPEPRPKENYVHTAVSSSTITPTTEEE